MQDNAKNLNKSNQSAKQYFIDWLASPPHLRTPSTQQELANKLNVNPVTLTRWKTDEFMDQVIDLAKKRSRHHTVEIIGSIISEAKKGSYQHSKLFLEYVEKWNPEIKQERARMEELLTKLSNANEKKL